jgi:hypothetical protein
LLNLLRKAFEAAAPGSLPAPAGPTSEDRAAESNKREAIDAILLEYDVQTRDRRLYAQSMFGTIGFVVAGTVALLAAATQASQPLTLLLIPPLLLAGGVLTVVLRIHLLRVSVFLTVVEDDLRRRLSDATYPIVWETTMTGRTEAVTSWSSPARSSAGLSLTVMLVMGVGLAGLFVWPATLLYWQAAGIEGIDLIGAVARLLTVPEVAVEWAYPALNGLLIAYIVYSWVRLPAVLEAARVHFRRTRSRITNGSDEVYLDSGFLADGSGIGRFWKAQWVGVRDGDRVIMEQGVGIPDRRTAEQWGGKRARRLYVRLDPEAEYELLSEHGLRRIASALRGS